MNYDASYRLSDTDTYTNNVGNHAEDNTMHINEKHFSLFMMITNYLTRADIK
jgi:hypothetical protein